jgi:hypothetical protein
VAQKLTPSSGSSGWLRGVAPQLILAELPPTESCYSTRPKRKRNQQHSCCNEHVQ